MCRPITSIFLSLRAQREVTIGRRRPGAAELLSGLKQGEKVVVEGVARMMPGTVTQSIGDHKLPEAASGGA